MEQCAGWRARAGTQPQPQPPCRRPLGPTALLKEPPCHRCPSEQPPAHRHPPEQPPAPPPNPSARHPPDRISFLRSSVTGLGGGAGAGKGSTPTRVRSRSSARPRKRRRVSSAPMRRPAPSAASERRSSKVLPAAAGLPSAAVSTADSSSRLSRPVMRSPGGWDEGGEELRGGGQGMEGRRGA
jgi:hypothetical protein